MLKYYLASILTTPQKMTVELENIVDSILYTPPLLFFESGIKNNKGIFSFDDLSSSPDQDKEKESI